MIASIHEVSFIWLKEQKPRATFAPNLLTKRKMNRIFVVVGPSATMISVKTVV